MSPLLLLFQSGKRKGNHRVDHGRKGGLQSKSTASTTIVSIVLTFMVSFEPVILSDCTFLQWRHTHEGLKDKGDCEEEYQDQRIKDEAVLA